MSTRLFTPSKVPPQECNVPPATRPALAYGNLRDYQFRVAMAWLPQFPERRAPPSSESSVNVGDLPRRVALRRALDAWQGATWLLAESRCLFRPGTAPSADPLQYLSTCLAVPSQARRAPARRATREGSPRSHKEVVGSIAAIGQLSHPCGFPPGSQGETPLVERGATPFLGREKLSICVR